MASLTSTVEPPKPLKIATIDIERGILVFLRLLFACLKRF